MRFYIGIVEWCPLVNFLGCSGLSVSMYLMHHYFL
jgi:hypothetical protein